MRFLLPVDGSQHSLRAVEYLIRLARCREALQVLLLNVREAVDTWEVRHFLVEEEIEKLQHAEAEADLRDARALLDAAGIAYEVRVLQGPVAETIAHFADEAGCDQIVMGTHGHSRLGELLLGSTASEVVHRARVPVTLVK